MILAKDKPFVVPNQWIPVDILVAIFESLLFSYDITKKSAVQYAYQPLTLTHVCRYWPEVALNSPTVWSRIIIVHSKSDLELRILRLYLERSKQVPLELFLMCDSVPSVWLKVYATIVREALPRCRLLHILPFSAVSELLFQKRSVELNLDGVAISFSALASVLRLHPAMVTLRLDSCDFIYSPSENGIVSMPILRVLGMECVSFNNSQEAVAAFLDLINAPMIEELSIQVPRCTNLQNSHHPQ